MSRQLFKINNNSSVITIITDLIVRFKNIISEIHVTTASPIGFGHKMLVFNLNFTYHRILLSFDTLNFFEYPFSIVNEVYLVLKQEKRELKNLILNNFVTC